MIDCDNDYVYFDNVTSIINTTREPELIDCTTLGDSSRHYIRGRQSEPPSLMVEFPITERDDRLFKKIQPNNNYRVRIELLWSDAAIEASADLVPGIPDIAQTEVIMVPIRLDNLFDAEFFNTVVPKDCTCPNCGAPISSRFGACDYCGGWIEWEF